MIPANNGTHPYEQARQAIKDYASIVSHHGTNNPQIRKQVTIGRIPVPPRDIEKVSDRIEKAIQKPPTESRTT